MLKKSIQVVLATALFVFLMGSACRLELGHWNSNGGCDPGTPYECEFGGRGEQAAFAD